jgi:hypothetical protein
MLTDPCAVTQKLSTGSTWLLASLEPKPRGQAGVAVDDCRDGVVPRRPNEAGDQRDTGERQHLGELWNRKPAPADLLAGGGSDARRTNSVFGNPPNPKIQMPSDATSQ